ncbi:MAG: hypothetical protein MMC23_008040 [Stictis urceolatum]|nr:hypothetical protein [Stictis urceolata]
MKAYVGHHSHFSSGKAKGGDILSSSNSWSTESIERAQAVLFDRSEHGQFRAFVDLLHRSWFRRTWILQEVVLGKEVHIMCGSQAMPFLDFFRSIINRRSMKEMLPELLKLIQVMHTLRAIHAQQLPQTPSLILRSSGPYLATDPKDKVFGICGLSERLANVQERASYHDSIAKIYTEAAIQRLKVEESVVFLVQSVPPHKNILDLPSWIPDFSRQNPSFWDLYTRRRQGTSSRVANTVWING